MCTPDITKFKYKEKICIETYTLEQLSVRADAEQHSYFAPLLAGLCLLSALLLCFCAA